MKEKVKVTIIMEDYPEVIMYIIMRIIKILKYLGIKHAIEANQIEPTKYSIEYFKNIIKNEKNNNNNTRNGNKNP